MRLIAGCLLFSGIVFAQGNATDDRFAREAAIGGMTEVQMGKLAIRNGTSDQVKSLGQRLVDDHSMANDQLKSLAAKDNFSLPSSLDTSHQAMVDRFSKMSGTAFDRAFLRDESRDHQNDLALFRSEASRGSNKDLKNFASSTIPTLQDHLQKTRDAERAIGMTSSSRTMPRK